METNRDRIERRLKREGWLVHRHGRNHDIYRHSDIEGLINLPRHRVVSTGVARLIAKIAGWTEDREP